MGAQFAVAVVFATSFVAGCTDGACTEAGCRDGLNVVLETGEERQIKGPLAAEMCLDDRCYTARGEISKRRGVGEGPLVVFAYGGELSAELSLAGRDLDEQTEHSLTLSIRVARGPAREYETDFTFDKVQPNGPDCAPTCLFAHLRAELR